MGSRAKKPIPKVKLSALDSVLTYFRCRYNDVWLICKKVWYVPFIWSLTWYMFWILRDVAVFNKSFADCNVLNYFGASISIVALMVALTHFFFGRTRFSKIFRIPSFSRQLLKYIRVGKPKQPKLKMNYHSSVENVQKFDEANTKRVNVDGGGSVSSRAIKNFDRGQMFQEVASECLTCPDLISCDYRQNKPTELGDKIQRPSYCRFAKESPSKSASSA